MKNMEFFTTEHGIASLVLEQIPYRKKAYVHIRSASDIQGLAKECRDFCRAVGAEWIYATGHEELTRYPHYTDIIKMGSPRDGVAKADACLFPVTEQTAEQWRMIYNKKMETVHNSRFLGQTDFQEFLKEHEVYYVHQDGRLLGIGAIQENKLRALAATEKGAGERVVRNLCTVISDDRIQLEVATANQKAVGLYERLGFIPIGLISSWYVLYENDQA